MKGEIGVLGMGVMGRSLSRNLARNGFKVSLYNRHVAETEENVAKNFKNSHVELVDSLAFDDLEEFVDSLTKPRKVLLMVNAGPTVDSVLNELSHFLENEDIIIDGGNPHYVETESRQEKMNKKGFHFIGTGVSGGEESALLGPSIMPSGDKESYAKIQKYLEAIAAKDLDKKPCCTYVGKQGSGHFVKMVHNGIEYAEMQLICECYAILKKQGMTNDEMAQLFSNWLVDLDSYLLRISIDILRKKVNGEYVLDQILDKAGNKGTGKWATNTIADSGEAATMIPAALFARYLSYFKDKRIQAAHIYSAESNGDYVAPNELKDAYQFSRIINHHQGFSLIEALSKQNNWDINLSEIARIWTAGCIIKSDLMKNLVQSLENSSQILFTNEWSSIIKRTHSSIQSVVTNCIKNQTHIPCLAEALNYFHGLKTAESSAHLIQAQRDYFGAHTYQRKDDSSGKPYHSHWH